MKTKVTILFIIISLILVSCGGELETPASNVSMTQEPLTTDTPMSDFTLHAVLQGNWLVETMVANEDETILGTLTIDDNSYHFYPTPDVEIPAWMQDRFCIFEQPTGKTGFEYESGVSPNDDVRTFEDRSTLLKWIGIGCGETFVIRVDQEVQELYVHAQVSEIQSYRIHKSYGN